MTVSKAKRMIGSFYIGMPVYGRYRAEAVYVKEKWYWQRRTLKRVPREFRGILVGARYVPLGEKTYEGKEEGWRFLTKSKVFVFLVRESFLGKEIQVLPDDLRVEAWRTTPDVPVLRSFWPEHYRDVLSKEMSNRPRDEKGRWKKRHEE